MAHLTYEEKFVVKPGPPYADNNDIVGDRFLTYCHPDFCLVCFRKMWLDGDWGPTGRVQVLKTNLYNYSRPERKNAIIYEPNGRGGTEMVLVRPHVRHGTACGWGNTSSSLGANLWHATAGTDRNSICQQDGTIDEAVEKLLIRPGSCEQRVSGDGLSDAQLKGLVANPSMMRARVFDEDENYRGWQVARKTVEQCL